MIDKLSFQAYEISNFNFLGNYGNKLDENIVFCLLIIQLINAVFDGCYYYFLFWFGIKFCVVVEFFWEDISFRLEGFNLLFKIIDILVRQENKEGIKFEFKCCLFG